MPEGLVLITPSSVTTTGTGSSATINANGSVTFSSCVTLQLNDIFSSTYDAYRVVGRTKGSVIDSLALRWVDGTTPATASNYVYQEYQVSGSTIVGSRSTATSFGLVSLVPATQHSGFVLDIYNPKLTEKTIWRSISVNPSDTNAGQQIYEIAGTHSLTTAYEGVEFRSALGGAFTGKFCVYGWNK